MISGGETGTRNKEYFGLKCETCGKPVRNDQRGYEFRFGWFRELGKFDDGTPDPEFEPEEDVAFYHEGHSPPQMDTTTGKVASLVGSKPEKWQKSLLSFLEAGGANHLPCLRDKGPTK